MLSFLQWYRWLRHGPLAGREVITVNMDETSVERAVPHRRGHVLSETSRLRRWHERIGRRESHSHMILVAFVCDRDDIQPYLPQVFMPKDEALSVAERAKFAGLPLPLYWQQGTAGWVTSANLPQVLTRLRRAILQRAPHAHIVLVMDCATQHLSHDVLTHVSRLGIVHVVLVPANLTWLLQPLDTHVFAQLKRKFAAVQQAERSGSPNGVLPPGRWVDIISTVVADVLVRSPWSHVFRRNGLSEASPDGLRRRVQDIMGRDVVVPALPPSEAQVSQLIGRARVGFRELTMRPANRLLEPPPLPPPPGHPGHLALHDAAEAEFPPAPRVFSPSRTRSGRIYRRD